jgi:hypothetical protein
MDGKERSSPRHWRVEDILGHLNDNVDKNNAEELLHCILAFTDILTWNLQGEIVYKGQNIRGTNIVDLLQYTVLPYKTEIPEPAGLNIFLKGLATLEIDKSLIVNGRVLTMLAHKQPLHDVDTQSDKSKDKSEDVGTTCNSCNKDLHISHLGTCPVCAWTDFYPNCTRCHCMICDFRLSEGNVTHVIASCSYCHCDEIMDVSTDKRLFLSIK